jgi:hypothetical protein
MGVQACHKKAEEKPNGNPCTKPKKNRRKAGIAEWPYNSKAG